MTKTKKCPVLALLTLCGFSITAELDAQVLSFDPQLPNTIVEQKSSIPEGSNKPNSALPTLSAYAGTYVGVVVYYNIDNGVGDWEVVFRKNGTIGLSADYQNKYPNANVSGTFLRDGTFRYTNKSGGIKFVTTGKINPQLEKLSARFTSSSAGTGTIICQKLVTE